MKIYYSDARRNQIISAKKPVEASAGEAKTLLSRLISPPSYLGIHIDDKTAFQAYLNADATVWIEMLNLENKGVQGTNVKLAIALEAIDHIYAGKSIIDGLASHYLRWTNARM